MTAAVAARPALRGHEEPRIFTPPARPLTPGIVDPDTGQIIEPPTTLGFAAIEFALHVLGVELYPWQRWLLIHALELREDGSFRFRNLIVLVARQNGKSTLSQVLALFFLYCVPDCRLVLGTAQDLDTAEEVWDGALEMVESTEELNDLALPPILRYGKKPIRLQNGCRYKVKAAGRRSGRGLSGDLIMLDELREHQTWDAWAAITKTTMHRENAQVWAFSNAGDASSVVLRYLRKMAHKVLGDPDGINANDDPASLLTEDDDAEDVIPLEEDDDSLFIAEWSAPPGVSVWDRDGWAYANPSLGHGGFTERAVASSAATDPEGVFRTEVLCQWVDGVLKGPFPAGSWDAGIDKTAAIAEDARVGYCLDVSWDRSSAYIGAAGLDDEGSPVVEIIARRPGTEWVVDWFTDPEHPHRKGYRVAIQPSGPAGSLIEELTEAGIEVIEWKGLDLGKACADFYDQVKEKHLRHRPAPVLDVAAGVAVTRSLPGDMWVWDRRKSPIDISGLVAATGALWLATAPVEEVDPFFAFA
jgi:phage terminase large subunit-like protein